MTNIHSPNFLALFIILLTLICLKYFATLLHEMGPQGHNKGNAKLIRQNDFSNQCNSLVQEICLFLQKETSHCKNSLAFGPQGPKQYISGDYFYSKIGISQFLDSGHKSWMLESGLWTLDTEPWTLDSEPRTLDSRL